MDAIDIAAELLHTFTMALICVGSVFCLACVIDARKCDNDSNDNRP